jgi:hypothetical protein
MMDEHSFMKGRDMNTKQNKQGDKQEPAQKQSNDLSGGYPRSPGGANRMSSDEDMDEDTGLSNRENRQAPIDQGARQSEQSNVGRRDDGTPD